MTITLTDEQAKQVRDALKVVFYAPREDDMGWDKHLLYEEERAQVIDALSILNSLTEHKEKP